MKNKILVLFIFGFTISFSAHKVTLSGTVKDSLQNPLPYANVIAKPKDVSKNLQFAITDNEGYYKLVLQQNDTITISISYLGYKPIEYLFTADKDFKKDFILQQSSEQLDEIVIEMPVTVRGDTTIYKTDKFVNGTERKLKNVLKNLELYDVESDPSERINIAKEYPEIVDAMLARYEDWFDESTEERDAKGIQRIYLGTKAQPIVNLSRFDWGGPRVISRFDYGGPRVIEDNQLGYWQVVTEKGTYDVSYDLPEIPNGGVAHLKYNDVHLKINLEKNKTH